MDRIDVYLYLVFQTEELRYLSNSRRCRYNKYGSVVIGPRLKLVCTTRPTSWQHNLNLKWLISYFLTESSVVAMVLSVWSMSWFQNCQSSIGSLRCSCCRQTAAVRNRQRGPRGAASRDVRSWPREREASSPRAYLDSTSLAQPPWYQTENRTRIENESEQTLAHICYLLSSIGSKGK